MQTDAQRNKDEAEFAAAFDEDMAGPAATSEDEAFGLSPDEVPGDATPEQEAAVALTDGGDEAASVEGDAAAGEALAAEAVAEEPAADPAAGDLPGEAAAPIEAEAEPVAEAAGDEGGVKTVQQLKSWEGRLRALEADLKSREAALKEGDGMGGMGGMGMDGMEGAGPDKAELLEAATEEASEIVASSGSLEEAITRLREDFGPEFVEMIQAIAAKSAGDAVAGTSSELKASLEALQAGAEGRERSEHFDYITDHHSDFFEVADSPEFAEWVKANPDHQATCDHGNKRAVVKMLNAFKESQKQADSGDDDALDDAAGVRSSGLQLPKESGAKATGFEEAWENY